MTEALIPPGDPERVAALHALGVLDTPPEERFDRISRLVAHLFDTPIAFVSLMDVNRQWFKSCIGLEGSETSRAQSFCAHAMTGVPLVVSDATRDPRFSDNPTVTGPPHFRSYVGHPLHSPGGHVVGTLCVMDRVPRMWEAGTLALLGDVAKWAETELASTDLAMVVRELQTSESRLRAIMGSAGEGIVVMAPDGTTQYVNAAAEQIVGHLPRSLIGKDFHATVHHSHADGSAYRFEDCPVHTALASGRTVHAVDEVYWRRDGSSVPIEMSCARIVDAGAVTGAVLVFRDVSERRELEHMKDQFVASVSHELRTPLTAIKGYLEEVLNEEVGPLNEEQREDLETVARNATRLGTLIDDLLTLSRTQAGGRSYHRGPVDLGEMVPDLVRDLSRGVPQPSAGFQVSLGDNLIVEGDANRLRQAVANLVTNAMKFNRPGGQIRIEGTVEGAFVVVAVHDEGVGIPAGEVKHLTQRFFRASTSGTVEGTGLGLAITGEIVERHGGRLEIESTVGDGSTFTLRLPRAG